MEAKYSSSKLDEIVEQLKKDHSIISNLKKQKVLYLGIMNEYMPAYYFINLHLNFDCILMLIKIYLGTYTEMKNDISILKNEIAFLKSGFDDLKGWFDDFKIKLDLIISNMSIKRVTLRKIKKKKKKYLANKKEKKIDKKVNNDS